MTLIFLAGEVMEKKQLSSHISRLMTTHTQFDSYSRENAGVSHFPVSNSELVKNLTSVAPSSLLSLALLHRLCCNEESNVQRRNELFLAVCDKFYKEKYLDESCVLLCDIILNKPDFGDGIAVFIKQMQKSMMSQFREPLSLLPTVSFNTQLSTSNLQVDIYSKNFEEIREIADGGFGKVVKAKHKVDGVTYAVKKVNFKLKNTKNFNKILFEAQSLAKLKHPNIVNYNNSWLEQSYLVSENAAGESAESEESESTANESFGDSRSFHLDVQFASSENEILGVYSSSSSSNLAEPSSNNINMLDKRKNNKDFTSSIVEEVESNDNNSLTLFHRHHKPPVFKLTLFIQMEYCDCDLRFLLDNRFTESGKEAWEILDPLNIFYQVLNGVSHIHSKNVIHRDLKPKNIFVTKDNCVKIGDFGLSCLLHQTEHVHENEECTCTLGVPSIVHGTPPYSAPEQKQGKDYDFKVDIYSLGIILFELMHPCNTRQELALELKKIAETGEYPADLSRDLTNLMKNLTMSNPKERPDAVDILKSPIFKNKSLKKKIDDIKLSTMNLRRKIANHEQVIVQLSEEQATLCMQLSKLTVEKDARIKLLEEQVKLLTEQLSRARNKN